MCECCAVFPLLARGLWRNKPKEKKNKKKKSDWRSAFHVCDQDPQHTLRDNGGMLDKIKV